MGGLDDKDVVAVNGNCLSLSNDVEESNFEHISVYVELEEALKPGVHFCSAQKWL